MPRKPNRPQPRSDAKAELEREFEAQLDAYMEEWEASLREAFMDQSSAEPAAPRPHRYPERKQRDLTADEKSRLRARIQRGDADIYTLAAEFGCSASQVAGIKAAMQR